MTTRATAIILRDIRKPSNHRVRHREHERAFMPSERQSHEKLDGVTWIARRKPQWIPLFRRFGKRDSKELELIGVSHWRDSVADTLLLRSIRINRFDLRAIWALRSTSADKFAVPTKART